MSRPDPEVRPAAKVYSAAFKAVVLAELDEDGVGPSDYLYPPDPINGYDLTGEWCVSGTHGGTLSVIVVVAGC